jgi:hypothetical protein
MQNSSANSSDFNYGIHTEKGNAGTPLITADEVKLAIRLESVLRVQQLADKK